MSYEVNLYPEWSWSMSRDNVFHECKRKYYYHYYGSHNGWMADATEEQKAAYRLKQLTNLYLIFGDAMHQVAQAAVTEWQFQKSIPSKDHMKKLIRDHLNRAFKESQLRDRWIQYPKKSIMLHEMYYDGKLPPRRVETVKERLEVCIDNFFKSKSYSEIISNDAIQVVEIEQLNTFNLLDDKIYVKLDLLFKREDDSFVIVDWKTGMESEQNDLQMMIYALYLQDVYKIPLKKMEMRVEYLANGECKTVKITEEEIINTKGFIVGSIEKMRQFVEDDNLNKPYPTAEFFTKPSKTLCNNCNYRGICSEMFDS